MPVFVKKLVSFFMGALIVVLAACAAPPTQIPTAEGPNIPTVTAEIPITGTDLENTQWMLVSFNEGGIQIPVISGKNAALAFQENGQAGGSGGCNTFSAQYQAGNGAISFGPISSTEMACTPEAVTAQEQRFFGALQSAGQYESVGNMLTIWYADGQNALIFSRATSSTPVQPTASPTALAPTTVGPTATAENTNVP